MRAYYINLDRSTGRRAFMEEQSARLGLELARIAAVDGREIPEAEHARLCPVPTSGKRLARSELACYLSHMEAWRRIVESGATWGAVFEDDVFLAGDVRGFLDGGDWIPDDADLVRLSSNALRLTLSLVPAVRHGARQLHRLHSRTVDIGGYIIRARHARALLGRKPHFATPVDRLLLDPPSGAVIYQLNPSLAVQAKWADFGFLSQEDARSQIQTEKPPHEPSPLSIAKVARELDAFRRKVLFPIALPVLQAFKPSSQRILVARVPFGDHR